jgi:hypothetical protein
MAAFSGKLYDGMAPRGPLLSSAGMPLADRKTAMTGLLTDTRPAPRVIAAATASSPPCSTGM